MLACKLIQFAKLPPLGEMYGSTYGYRTSLSKLMVNHMKKFNKFIKLDNLKRFNILDIGSNDGTFLNFFSKLNKKLNLYGIDPSAFKFKKYYNNKINLITDYFSYETITDKISVSKKNLSTFLQCFMILKIQINFAKIYVNY